MNSMLQARRIRPSLSSGSSLTELMIVVAVLVSLSISTGIGLLRSARLSALRSSAVELAGYLNNAQAVAAGSINSCALEVTGSGDSQRIGPAATSPNACAGLGSLALLSGSFVPLGLTVATTGNLVIRPRGTLEAPVTIRLSASNVGGGEYCVQLLPPAALVGIGVFRNNICDHAAFN